MKSHQHVGRVSAAALLVAIGVSGCTLGPDFKLPFLNLPKKFPEQELTAAKAPLPVPTNWWLLYGDPALTKLVAAGLQDNTDVRLAIARLEEAEAFVREVAAASLFPEIDGKAQAERLRSSRLTGTLPVLTPAMVGSPGTELEFAL